MTPGDWLSMVFALVWVAAELLVPELMGTRRPVRRSRSGRMAQRPYAPAPVRHPGQLW